MHVLVVGGWAGVVALGLCACLSACWSVWVGRGSLLQCCGEATSAGLDRTGAGERQPGRGGKRRGRVSTNAANPSASSGKHTHQQETLHHKGFGVSVNRGVQPPLQANSTRGTTRCGQREAGGGELCPPKTERTDSWNTRSGAPAPHLGAAPVPRRGPASGRGRRGTCPAPGACSSAPCSSPTCGA